MKWLANIFKRENIANSSRGFSLSDLDFWLAELSQDHEYDESIKKIYAKIESISKELRRDMKSLESAHPADSTPSRLLNAGLASRDALLIQIKGLLEKLVPPPSLDFGSAANYHSRIVKGLGNTASKFGRAQRYVAALFPKEAEKLNIDLSRLSRLLVDLDRVVKKRQKDLDDISVINDLGSRVREEIRNKRTLCKDLEDNKLKLGELRALEKKSKSEQEELNSSAKGQELESLKDMLERKRLEQIAVEREVTELVSPLTKAVARVIKQDSKDRLELQHKSVFELLSRSPLDALNSDISGPLLELQSLMDFLGLKDKKREKILAHIDCLIQDKSLQKLKAKHNEIILNVNILEKELSENSLEITELEAISERTSQQIERLEASIEQNNRNLSALEEKVLADKTELKVMVERIACKPMVIDLEE